MISLSVSRVAICKLVRWYHRATDMTVDSCEEMKCLAAAHEINLYKSDGVAGGKWTARYQTIQTGL